MHRIVIVILLSFFYVGAQIWNETQKVVASDRESGDDFGGAVSIDGSYMVVGAPFEDQDVSGSNYLNFSGSAYIFERGADGNWNEVQKVVASDREEQDQFGRTVSISGDYAIIGAPLEGDDLFFNTDIGSAYIFERAMDSTWNEVQKIRASDENGRDQFGSSVSISGDYAVIGARLEDEDVLGANTKMDSGSAYIFKRDTGGTWNEIQKIVASDREDSAHFGSSVSLSGDYVVVGAYLEDKDASGANILNGAGAAYIFKKDAGGVWIEVQKIVASDRNIDDSFGDSFIDGDYIIVGAYSEDEDINGNNTLNDAGSAYVFKRDINSVWSQIQKLVASDRNTDDYFGFSASISGDYALISAYGANADNTLTFGGAVYMYNLSPPLSVIENDFGSLIKVYPNPINGALTIDLGLNYDSIEVEVINSLGQQLFTKGGF